MSKQKQLWYYLQAHPYSALAIVLLALAILIYFPPLIDWAFLEATFTGNSKKDCHPGGACWALIHSRWEQFIYGFYPAPLRWRVNVAFVILSMSLANLALIKVQLIKRLLFLVASYIIIFYLLYGGVGLKVVPTHLWGGLFLTIFLAFGSMTFAFFLGILLALGRNSPLLLIKGFCIIFIELIRGVPLVTILFMAGVMSPLFLPEEMIVDKLLSAFIGLTCFASAYAAEVIRAGLNSLPKGQIEGAYALGMSYWQTMGLVILPQALRTVIPGLVNNFIALFKDTTLVLIIGIYDFLGIVQLAITDPLWLGSALEAYLFCALVYWVCCFSMSFYSRYLEKKLSIGSI
ncbi:MAG: amino acid ABC transporter permease [Proteobacteria bacterium]|nr:amino acid ABC transporter permease [Pseudomonadota bacterium]